MIWHVAVQLPAGENLCEWLSANTIDFFNQVNLLYGAVSDFCTPASCPTMSAGPSYEYLWQGGPGYAKPTAVPAQKYVELAQLQYFNGVINYLDVLDAQRKYFDAQIGLSNAVRDEHLAMVDLYKALGGGWGVERE